MKFVAASALILALLQSASGKDRATISWADLSKMTAPDKVVDAFWEPGDNGIETCDLQKDIVKFTIQRHEGAYARADCPHNCSLYTVCLQLMLPANHTSIQKTCVKDSSVCSPPDASAYLDRVWNASVPIGLASGSDVSAPAPPAPPTTNDYRQCQTGHEGEELFFSLVDGYRCRPTDLTRWPDYAKVTGLMAKNNANMDEEVKVECRSRKGWKDDEHLTLGTCDCTLDFSECVWRVKLPECVPEPSTFIEEVSPGCHCPDVNSECRSELNKFEDQGYLLPVQIEDCTDPRAIADEINKHGNYGCDVSSLAGCNTIVCTSFVPQDLYRDLSTCPVVHTAP